MTDLCYDDGAEANCEAAILSAFAVDDANLDAMQALVSLRLSQQRAKEASQIMEQVYERISSVRSKLNARTVIEEISGAPDPVDPQGLCVGSTDFAVNTFFDTEIPETEFCISTAKLLIECAAVNPNHLEVWYRMLCCSNTYIFSF
jgi:hypothetical protein